MESFGVFPDGEWGSFSAIFTSDELQMPRFIGNFSSPENHDAGVSPSPPTCLDPPANIGISGANKSWFYSLDALDTDFNLTEQDYSYSFLSSLTSQPNDMSMLIDMDSLGEKKAGSFLPPLSDVLEEDNRQALCSYGEMGGDGFENLDCNHPPTLAAINSANEELKRKFNGGVLNTHLSNNPKKKTRVTQPLQKSRKTVEPSKSTFEMKKNSSKTSVEEDGYGGSEGQSSSCCSTVDDNASDDTNGAAASESKRCEALNSNGKTRAERGSATDPQSLYARKRRERINERLRILQKLVPNGTKVDISTMLEEAVHYVKFLQLQIKLLSSDDHWIYAPIAYNGMDIGLHQKTSPILFH